MTTKILAIGDIHIRLKTLGKTREMTEKVVSVVDEQKPDIVVLLGDLLHTHNVVDTPCLNHAYDLIDKLRQRTQVYIIVGNHDYISNSEFLTDKHWMNGLKDWEGVKICDTVSLIEHCGNKFVMSPYVEKGRFKEGLNTIGDDWKDVASIFAHQEFYGCKFETNTSPDGDRWEADDPLVISGHIHKKHTLAHNIIYTGSVMQHNFGEDMDKSIWLGTYKNNKLFDKKEIDLCLPKYYTVRCKLEELDDLVIPDRDFMRVWVDCEPGEFSTMKKTDTFKKLVSYDVKVELRTTNTIIHEGQIDGENCCVKDNGVSFKNILYESIKDDSELVQDFQKIFI